MANVVYNSALKELDDGTINYLSDTIKVMLVTSSYTPNRDTHSRRSSVTNEVSGTNYTAGGFTLGSKTITQDNTLDRATYDAADVTADPITFTGATQAVVYKSTGVAANDNLICCIDLGGTYSPVAGPFTIQWSSTGGVLYKEQG